MATNQIAPEFIAQSQNLYKTNLGRQGDTEGVNYWANELASGKSQEDVGSAFKNSAKIVYQDYLTNPNNKYLQNQEQNKLLSSDLKTTSNIGKSVGSAQGVAQQNLVPEIYKNLYGGTPDILNPTNQEGKPLGTPPSTGLVTGLLNATTAQPQQAQDMPVSVGYAPQMAAAEGYKPTEIKISPESSSQYQLNKMLRDDSPLIQQGETFGLQQAGRRGLLNSSMAVGAAQGEMIARATPFAQQDANTRAQADTFNATATNRAGEFNANLQSQMAQFNASAANQAGAFKASAQNQSNLQVMQNQSQERITQFNANAQAELAKLNANTQLSVADKNAASQRILADKDAAVRKELQAMQSATQLEASKFDAKTKAELAAINANNEQLLRTNASAASLSQTVLTNIANIQSSKDIDEVAKGKAIATQLNNFRASLDALGEVSKLDLGKYFVQVQADANKPIIPTNPDKVTTPNDRYMPGKYDTEFANVPNHS